jgi:hypothetical protein
MDRKLWEAVYQMVMTAEHESERSDVTHGDRTVVLVYLWSVAWHQGVAWACDPEHWCWGPFPATWPSQSAMSRRLRSASVQALLASLEAGLRALGGVDWVCAVDGRPLTINPYSKDRDARWGFATKTLGRGYRWVAVWGRGPIPLAWDVVPLQASEPRVAETLVARLSGGGYLVGDSAFDTNRLHAVAAAQGFQLLAPPKRPGRKLGHCPHHPARIRSLELLRTDFGRAVYATRTHIEQRFGHLALRSLGLAELPAHVRCLHRVRQYVQGKLILNGIYLLFRQQVPPLAA